MLDAPLLARLGLERLGLPVPSVKLAIMHEAARALRDDQTGELMWNAFRSWLATRETESEVGEALCIVLLAKNSPYLSISDIRLAIRRPSVLSDELIGQLGSPLLVASWSQAHSGEVPPFFTGSTALDELAARHMVPGIIQSRLKALQKETGRPYLRQWAFEFTRMSDSMGPQADGPWSYFGSDDRRRSVGQFVSRRGHLARSAYLRTMAAAVQHWNLPERRAVVESFYAGPADYSFLQMLPAGAPHWIATIGGARPTSEAECDRLVRTLLANADRDDEFSSLMHMNCPLPSSARYQGQLEVVTAYCDAAVPNGDQVFDLHNSLPGEVVVPRDSHLSWIVLPNRAFDDVGAYDGARLLPALLPCVQRFVGYLHADLLSRMPYVPANYSSSGPVIVRPRAGGADIEWNGVEVGRLFHWNSHWAPMYDKSLGAGCGVAMTLSANAMAALQGSSRLRAFRAWKATILSRPSDYGDWTETQLSGTIV